jgi:RimJ/RimL family protein N-acetyltransferase
MKSYTENGFGLWKVSLTETGVPIGMCGLIRRETLPTIDIGYAFLPAFRAQGYAFEAAFACKEFARLQLKVDSLCGIANHENHRSIKVLTQLGMRFERSLRMQGADHDVNLYLVQFGA